MRENEIIVSDNELADEWFFEAIETLDGVNTTIKAFQDKYNFNLFNNEEHLSEKDIKAKRTKKANNIVLPITYAAECLLKSMIIKSELPFRSTFNRSNGDVMNIFKDINRSYNIRGNLHNTAIFMNYLNDYEDSYCLELISLLYKDKRDISSSKFNVIAGSQLYPNDLRIKDTIEMYKNAFIEFRYAFEKQAQEDTIDLVKLIDYVESVKDYCLFYRLKCEVFNIILKNYSEITPNLLNSTFENNYNDYLKSFDDTYDFAKINIEKLINLLYVSVSQTLGFEFSKDSYNNDIKNLFYETFNSVNLGNIIDRSNYSFVYDTHSSRININEKNPFNNRIYTIAYIPFNVHGKAIDSIICRNIREISFTDKINILEVLINNYLFKYKKNNINVLDIGVDEIISLIEKTVNLEYDDEEKYGFDVFNIPYNKINHLNGFDDIEIEDNNIINSV